jgi:hypothetical protein
MMTLDNLVAIGRLQRLTPDEAFVRRLAAAARRNLEDARVEKISTDARFDLAYKSIMQHAMAALAARGYRTSTSQPGHHQTAIQCLAWTLGVSRETLITLDALRKQRNLSDYSGDPISEATTRGCITEAEALAASAYALHAAGQPAPA